MLRLGSPLYHRRGIFKRRNWDCKRARSENKNKRIEREKNRMGGRERESQSEGLVCVGMHQATSSINLLPLHLHTSYSPILIFLLTYRVWLLNHRRLSPRRLVGFNYSRRSVVKGIWMFVSRRSHVRLIKLRCQVST